MNPFRTHTGRAAVMNRSDVDTDQIIPKQFLKRIERTGFGQFLFFDWRFHDDGSPNPEFELNQDRFSDSTILIAARNFGCGSSREHAVWALDDYGFRVVIAPSFADIFYNNCFKNGVLPISLAEDDINRLMDQANDGGYELTIDLEKQTVCDAEGRELGFEIESFRRECLLNGLDDIALTLKQEEKITSFEKARGIK